MRKAFFSLLSLLLLGLAGCQTQPTPDDPVNSATYLLNTLESRTSADIDAVIAAFQQVMGDRGFVRTDLEETNTEAILTFRGDGDVGVQVKLKAFPQFTNIKIRYTLTGDEYQSRRLLDQVIAEL